MIRHIRPFEFFALLDEPIAERTAHITIPHRRAAGSLTLLEMMVLLSAIRTVRADRIFEFGTFLGATTLNIALNTSSAAEIFTLDLDAPVADAHEADRPLTVQHLAADHGKALDFTQTPENRKICKLYGDSRKFDFSRWYGTIDLVFIDGGHDLSTVKSDTENSFKMLTERGPACILWHDYRNRDYPDLTEYLESISENQTILHIEDTMLCAAMRAVNLKKVAG